METYNPDAKCIKCGHDVIKSSHNVYQKDRHFRSRCGFERYHHPDEEHISRYCMRCGYKWFEKPLDAKVD